ncbi:MAG TPA: fatty acid desaturase [Gemmatimonadaceae bacterium]
MSDTAASHREVDWRRAVEPFVGPNARRASFQMLTTLVPLALTMWAIHSLVTTPAPLGLSPFVAHVLAVALAFPAAGLLVRTFIIMHDCAHGSFFNSRRLNDIVGFATGVMTLTPFAQWRRDHALHHASSGDLDRRGHGDVPTLTVTEYLAKSPGAQRAYRTIRHPAVLLLGGPLHLALGQRFRKPSKATRDKQMASVTLTNVALVAVIAIALFLFGLKSVLMAYALPYYLAAMAGVWLFYVQHQFEDAYWTSHADWTYADAALLGSTHLRLPRVLQWFTGNIGLHHVHHVAPRIPNYRLQNCHDANAMFARSPVVTVRSGVAALRLALWDESTKRMIRFCDVIDQ